MHRTILLVLVALTCRADLLVSRGTQGVDRYTDNGVFAGNFIAPGTGGLVDARGIAVGTGGNVFVGEWTTGQILEFSPTGSFVSVFSSDAAVDAPFSLVFGTGGSLFVASAGPMSNIAVLDPASGAVINAAFTADDPMHPLGGPQYMAFGTNGILYLTDIAGRMFRQNATTGAHISTSLYDNPEGVAFGPDDLVYLAQRISNDLLRLSANSPDSPTEIVPHDGYTGEPQDLKFGPNGYLYLSTTNRIFRIDVSGPSGVIVDSFGDGGQFFTFFQPVPEPSAVVLVGFGIVGVLVLRRKRRG